MNSKVLQIQTRQRSTLPEIMDDFNLSGTELRQTLDQIGKINRFLGGNSVTTNGIWHLTRRAKWSTSTVLHIVDMGCGHGEILRDLVHQARRKNQPVRCTGIDANADAIKYAQELSVDFPEIEFLTTDFFQFDMGKQPADIIISTLTLHHLDNTQIVEILKKWKAARLGVVINDLHRSWWACLWFRILSHVLNFKPMPKYDGLISILRGFTKKELMDFSTQIGNPFRIQWKWAYRYQWIIYNE